MVMTFNMFGLGVLKDMIFGHFNVADVVIEHSSWSWFYVFDLS